jgi:hypothetical protein
MERIYLYTLGKHYQVDDILPHAFKGFAKTTQALRSIDMDPDGRDTAFFIELVYRLPGLDDTDALRQEATKQAELLVGNMTIKIPNEIVDKETRKHVEEILPSAGPSVLARGIKPKIYELQRTLMHLLMQHPTCRKSVSVTPRPVRSSACAVARSLQALCLMVYVNPASRIGKPCSVSPKHQPTHAWVLMWFSGSAITAVRDGIRRGQDTSRDPEDVQFLPSRTECMGTAQSVEPDGRALDEVFGVCYNLALGRTKRCDRCGYACMPLLSSEGGH